MYFIYAYICILFSLSLWHVSSARAPPQFFSPLFQFHFTLPQFHFTAAKKAPETCACLPLPCMFPSSAHLFPHSCDLWLSITPPGPQVGYIQFNQTQEGLQRTGHQAASYT